MSSISGLVCVCFIFIMTLGKSEAQLAPALYVFGDSTVDAGNNNMINTYAKSNYAPYGIDFPGGITGRPTNGRNMADFVAELLRLKVPPAFRLVDRQTYNDCQGFNYASSSAGILPDSGFKGTLSLGEQVGLFRKTVEEYLPLYLKNKDDLSNYLSKSIFLSVMGVNDYALNFLKKKNSGQPFDEDVAAQLLVENYANYLRELYMLGAKKFVVFNIEAMGCLPAFVNQLKPQNSKCVDGLNSMVLKFNENLQLKLKGLASSLPGSNFIIGDNYKHILNLVEKPASYGLQVASDPCCAVTPFGSCDAKRPPCQDRQSYVFFDAFHPTEVAYKIMAQNCFSGSGACVPMNIQQLASIQVWI